MMMIKIIGKEYIKWIILLFAGFSLRIYQIEFQSLWYEELMTLKFSGGNSFLEFISSYIKSPDFHPPLYPALVYFLKTYGVNADWFLKLPSVLFNLGCIPLVYILAKNIFNTKVGWISAILMTFSGANIYYSQEVRYNSMLIFFMLLLIVSCIHICKKEKSKTKDLIIYTIFLSIIGLCLAYTHYTGTYICMTSLVLFSCLNKKRMGLIPFIVSIVFVLIVFLPWWNVLKEQSTTWSIYRSYNQNPNIIIYIQKMINFSFVYETYWQGLPFIIRTSYIQNGFTIFFVGIMFIGIGKSFLAKKEFLSKNIFTLKNTVIIYIFLLAFGSIVVFFIHDLFFINKYFYEKALFYTIPFLYIIFAALLSWTLKGVFLNISVLLLLSMFIFQPFINQNYYHTLFKTEFRQISQFVKKIDNNSPVFLLCGDIDIYKYYFKKYNINNVKMLENNTLTIKEMKNLKRFWVVFAHCYPSLQNISLMRNLTAIAVSPTKTLAHAILFERSYFFRHFGFSPFEFRSL